MYLTKMKQLLLITITVLSAAFTTQAQFQKGRLLTGGDAGFSFQKEKLKSTNSSGTTSLTITEGNLYTAGFSPRVGYFFTDHIVAGLEFNIESSWFNPQDESQGISFSNTSAVVGPFVRYYTDFGLFGLAKIGFGQSTNVIESNGFITDQRDETNITLWSLGGGYAFRLNDHVALEPTLAYTNIRTKDNEDADVEVKNIGSGLAFSIGLSIFL